MQWEELIYTNMIFWDFFPKYFWDTPGDLFSKLILLDDIFTFYIFLI